MPFVPEARRLFADTTTDQEFARRREKATAHVGEGCPDALSASSTDEVVREVVAAHHLDGLSLRWGAREGGFADKRGANATDLGSTSTRTVVEYIPFSGPPGLFDMRPSEPPADPIDGSVLEAEVVLWGLGLRGVAAGGRDRFEVEEANLRAWVAAVNRDVDAFNADLRREVRAAAKVRIGALRAETDALAALGLPLRPDRRAKPAPGHTGRRPRVTAGELVSDVVPRRHAGRPAWTREVFEERLAEAERLTRPPLSDPRVVKNFRGLDDSVGEHSSSWLTRLRKRFAATDE